MDEQFELLLHLLEYGVMERLMILLEELDRFYPHREWTIQRLREVADKLDDHNFRGNIARAAGGGSAAVAGILGLVFAPVTFGISAVVGTGIAAGGVITAYGTKAVLWKLSSDAKKEVDYILDEDEQAYADLQEEWNELNGIFKRVERMQQEWTWRDVVDGASWLLETVTKTIASFSLGKLGKYVAIIGRSLLSALTDEYFKTNIVKPLLDCNFKLLFHNLASFFKKIGNDRELWVDLLQLSKMAFGVVTTGLSTAVGGFIAGSAGTLAIIGANELISAIISIKKGSVSDTAIIIRNKAEELEEQMHELHKFQLQIRRNLDHLAT